MGLMDYTGYLLRVAFLRAAAIAAQILPAGAHPRDAAILATLEAVGPCSQQQLSDSLNVNRTAMVKLIDSISSGVPKALTEIVTLGRTLKKRETYCPPSETVPIP